MTYPTAIVCAAALIAGAIVWSAEAKEDQATGQQIRAVAGGQLIWWLETAGKGTRVAFCGLAGREIECQSKVLAEAD